MIKKNVVVGLIMGIHARPAANLVKLANSFMCNTFLEYNDKKINAKDIWDVLSNGIDNGSHVTVICDGEDENNAIEKISAFISNEEGS